MGVALRLQKLRQKIVENELEGLLVCEVENRYYLSGFGGADGFLFISPRDAILATDFRYVEQARKEATEFEIVQVKGGLSSWFPHLASGWGIKRLGFEASSLSFASYQQLSPAVDKIELIPTEGIVESLRAIKEEEEVVYLVEAARLADAAMEYARSIIHPGMKEEELAWEMEKFLRENGSDSLPFDIIVASGPNSALPHAKPTERPILEGEPIIIDLGAKVAGYASDLSRTICLGPADKTFTEVYGLVLRAQLAALATLETGMSGEEVDYLARKVIEQGGYGDAFGHGLGHGVGLAPHEQPRLGPNSESVLAEGMVFTIEPGIYLPGWGGVRIEDMVILEKEGLKALSKAGKIEVK
jgi:Xaa-Pro aminopeptidase